MRPRILAVDWSGAVRPRNLWLAEACAGRLVDLVRIESRDRAVDELIRRGSETTGPLVAGLDFAFSFPAEFLGSLGSRDANAMWNRLAQEGEEWLRRCAPPFWGKPGRRRPAIAFPQLRRTESEVPATSGIRPKSVFQIGGAGAVGVGSLRGMRFLARLRAAGFSVWPFHPAGRLTVIEIYPRLLTGPVCKSDPRERSAFLQARWPALGEPWLSKVLASEDAFDAAVSALVMDRFADELARLPAARDAWDRLEGQIWHPASSG